MEVEDKGGGWRGLSRSAVCRSEIEPCHRETCGIDKHQYFERRCAASPLHIRCTSDAHTTMDGTGDATGDKPHVYASFSLLRLRLPFYRAVEKRMRRTFLGQRNAKSSGGH